MSRTATKTAIKKEREVMIDGSSRVERNVKICC